VRFVRCRSVFVDGRFAPDLDHSEELVRRADRVVVAVGQSPDDGLAAELAGLLAVGPEEVGGLRRLPSRSVHVGGDLGRTGGTVVEAVADGRRAAAAIDAALRLVPA
jgi:NADPH-dependent glutamate synthase beta subunit-like oxidoreductase